VKNIALVLVAGLLIAGCQSSSEGGVVNKVLADFGLKERPEGYVAPSDRVFERLDEVGAGELKRLNMENRRGEIKFQEDGPRGLYYKETKFYEDYYPLDAQVTHSSPTDTDSHTYNGYIEYSYRVYQSARKQTRAEAEAESADIPTDEMGRETYRYRFNAGGAWMGGKGERVKH
jgi:hypothetical protein